MDSNPLILDGHNDSLHSLFPYSPEKVQEYLHGRPAGHLDLPRARRGGLGGGFFAVYVPPDPALPAPADAPIVFTDDGYEVPYAAALEPGYAQRTAIALTAGLFRLESESGGEIKVARTVAELAACLESGVLAAILHFEGAEPIDPGLDALEVFYRAGLRSLGLVWSRPNLFAHGVPFRFPRSPDTGPGLTEEGRALVRACNRLGILLDGSHLNERGFWDLASLSEAPLVATHSAAHALCPMTRNLTGRQLAAIRESDGMVGVNFDASALRPDGKNEPEGVLEELVRHIDYLVEHLEIDRVGFGSDFDGATMPAELGDAAGLPKLLNRLRERGYDAASLRKLAHENWLRVLRKTWKE